jgi:hypothetical protein
MSHKCATCKTTDNNVCEINCRNFNVSLFNFFYSYQDYCHPDCKYQNQQFFIKTELFKRKDEEQALKIWAEFYIFAKYKDKGILLDFDNITQFNHAYE